MLEVGTKAPAFSLPDQNGQVHSLEEYRGKKVILYFYPKDSTAGCMYKTGLWIWRTVSTVSGKRGSCHRNQ